MPCRSRHRRPRRPSSRRPRYPSSSSTLLPGRRVAPGPGVSRHEFTGAMVAPPTLAAATGPGLDGKATGGDPVDLGTGLFVLTNTDLQLPDVLPISLQRTYRQNDTVSRAFGI